MQKKLIIVESPTKAKTIAHFLDSSYQVIASKGHVRDLSKYAMGISIQEDKFYPRYAVCKDHEDIVAKILSLAKSAAQIYIATDEDREGEAIGYHIAYLIKEHQNKAKKSSTTQEIADLENQTKQPTNNPIFTLPRIVFHEITKSAILHALENPKTLDVLKINAQLARRLLDRIVGFSLSALLAHKISRGMSAGRVQSAALKIVVDREREIKAFKPVIYYNIEGDFEGIEASLDTYKGAKVKKQSIKDKEEALSMCAFLKEQSFSVQEVVQKNKVSPSPPPFMTSTLQQSASTNLGYGPSKTMGIAQKLYEGVATPEGVSGVITYMRTDSLHTAKEAKEAAKEFIKNTYGSKYLPKTPKTYTSKNKAAQEAHEAIRPTNLNFTPALAKEYLKPEEHRLYTLIYQRFLASQMADALFEQQSVYFGCENAVFKANGRKMVFEGYLKVLQEKSEDKLLPPLQVKQAIGLNHIKAQECSTEAPPRYSEASLIKTLESLGIGRPSTYAPTIALLINRDYVGLEKKQLVPTQNAFVVVDILEKHFTNIVDAAFSASLEDKLDAIASSKASWQQMLMEFYTPFMRQIEEGKAQIASQKVSVPTGLFCPQCGAQLVERKGRFGAFVACSAYPKCKFIQVPQNENAQEHPPCEKCGSPMLFKVGRFGQFLACSAYPKCKNIRQEAPKVEGISHKCPECGGQIVQKRGKKGGFFGCNNYPKCNFLTSYQPIEKPCPKCGYLMVYKPYKKKPSVNACLKCKFSEEVAQLV
ncbi:type I DNA topoisomerase [Helicobacter ailurogastricus]|uniref:type I DNA topoisomerase n=1 Tax=Helicobacter ailurogastricus TaxID=1578720 RepID=UPI0022CA9E76|nr:type I DNA topoisomerase [Helicobacter ailurogastricus]GLH57880.1 DNA topoisomerase I TopA [Helicobacter ailurogastricus]GLH59363.1 DNA topoisomerase I TopA [Helicobacter ailurogastricus]